MTVAQVIAAINSLLAEFLRNMNDPATQASELARYQPKFRDLLRLASEANKVSMTLGEQRALAAATAGPGGAQDVADQSPKHIPSLLLRVDEYLKLNAAGAYQTPAPSVGMGGLKTVLAVAGVLTAIGLAVFALRK